MKAFAVLLVAFCTSAALTSRGVQAAPLGVPATVYPPGTHISYLPRLTNAEMDCLWGFFCEGNVPLFHCETQDQLHRVSGWGQFARVQHDGRTTAAFELFVSRYDPVPDETGTSWSKRAFLDLKRATRTQGYLLDRPDGGLPATRQTRTLLGVHYLGNQDLVVMASWSGTLEIEGIALYDHRPAAARQTAWASLARQIHLASKRGT